jgi:hypothetical protein
MPSRLLQDKALSTAQIGTAGDRNAAAAAIRFSKRDETAALCSARTWVQLKSPVKAGERSTHVGRSEQAARLPLGCSLA